MIKLSVTYVKPRATVAYVKATIAASSVEQKFSVQFQDINTIVNYVKAVAVDVALDPSSLNQYFRDETFSVTDGTPTYELSRSLSDSFSVTDSFNSTSTGTQNAADSFSVSETISALLTLQRSFSDSVNVSDSSSWDFGGNYTDSFSLSDTTSYSLARSQSDSFSATDATPSMQISLSGTSFAESVTISEQHSFGMSLGQFSDTASISDNITAQLIIASSVSAFNKPAFNAVQFNQR